MRQKPGYSHSHIFLGSFKNCKQYLTFFFVSARLHCCLIGPDLVSSCRNYSPHNISQLKLNQVGIPEADQYFFRYWNMKGWPFLSWRYIFGGTRHIFQRKFHSSSLRKEGVTQRFLIAEFYYRGSLKPDTDGNCQGFVPCLEHRISETIMHSHDSSKICAWPF